jgi:kynurenine formamidase
LIINLEHNGKNYKIDTTIYRDLSIPYDFNGSQPNFFNVEKGKVKPYESNLISKNRGCNVPEISMNIHCTGTHTECVGHLLKEPSSVSKCMMELYLPTVLITIKPINFVKCSDTYHVDVDDDEKVISIDLIKEQYEKHIENRPLSIIIRTLPNPEEKQFYSFPEKYPPFFTNDALKFLSNTVEHLVVDIPSIDRMEDDGILGNHRIFWSNNGNPTDSVQTNSKKTITELAYVPNDVQDGFYFMNIQMPNFKLDAAPSRPIIMKTF